MLLAVGCGDNFAGPQDIDPCRESGPFSPIVPDGTSCDDGYDCTQMDVCRSGRCTGTLYACPSPGGSDDCHVGVCNGDGTCSVDNVPDGQACCGPLSASDCAAMSQGRCTGGVCDFNVCGNGNIDLVFGESCDDSNLVSGDGCDANCRVEPFTTTGPVKISGTLACTTAIANVARKIAIDGSGTIYAVMKCGGKAEVVVSRDRGLSFSDPLDLSTEIGPLAIREVAVATGPSGVAYVAIMLADNQVYLRTTQDRGATWAAAIPIGTTTNSGAGLSLESFNNDIYIGFASPGGVSVARNHNRGAGAFATTPVAMGIVFFDLMFDIKLGTLAVCTDTPTFHVRVSSDAGVSFAAEVNPPGEAFVSDWAIGNGQIFVSGLATPFLFIIPANAPSTSTFVNGLPETFASRALAADDGGNAFIASQLDSGGVQLDRLAAGAATFDAPRTLAAMGQAPIVAPLPGKSGAAVVYTIGTEVWATVQAY